MRVLLLLQGGVARLQAVFWSPGLLEVGVVLVGTERAMDNQPEMAGLAAFYSFRIFCAPADHIWCPSHNQLPLDRMAQHLCASNDYWVDFCDANQS